MLVLAAVVAAVLAAVLTSALIVVLTAAKFEVLVLDVGVDTAKALVEPSDDSANSVGEMLTPCGCTE